MVFVVILLSKRFVILPDNWLQSPTIREETKVFFSPVPNAQPNFELATKFLFNKDACAVYKGYVVKHFRVYRSLSITCFENDYIYNLKYLWRFRKWCCSLHREETADFAFEIQQNRLQRCTCSIWWRTTGENKSLLRFRQCIQWHWRNGKTYFTIFRLPKVRVFVNN